MPRNADSPHRIHQARRPSHISDDLADKTVHALSSVAHGDKLRSRSRESSDSAGAVIDRLLAESRVPSSARISDQSAASGRHPAGGERLTEGGLSEPHPRLGESHSLDRGGRAFGSRKAAQDAHRDENRAEEPPAVIQARLRRTAVIPRVLTVPCLVHNAQVGTHCYSNPKGVCWRRVKERAAKP